MIDPIIALNLTLLALALLAMAGYAYLDAPEYDMNPRKWAAISFFVPFFGFFAYIFERDERKPTPEHDPQDHFVGGGLKIHKNRADDVPWLNSEDIDPPPGEAAPAAGERDTTDQDDDDWGERGRNWGEADPDGPEWDESDRDEPNRET